MCRLLALPGTTPLGLEEYGFAGILCLLFQCIKSAGLKNYAQAPPSKHREILRDNLIGAGCRLGRRQHQHGQFAVQQYFGRDAVVEQLAEEAALAGHEHHQVEIGGLGGVQNAVGGARIEHGAGVHPRQVVGEAGVQHAFEGGGGLMLAATTRLRAEF